MGSEPVLVVRFRAVFRPQICEIVGCGFCKETYCGRFSVDSGMRARKIVWFHLSAFEQPELDGTFDCDERRLRKSEISVMPETLCVSEHLDHDGVVPRVEELLGSSEKSARFSEL
jgi:hypothetical protein